MKPEGSSHHPASKSRKKKFKLIPSASKYNNSQVTVISQHLKSRYSSQFFCYCGTKKPCRRTTLSMIIKFSNWNFTVQDKHYIMLEEIYIIVSDLSRHDTIKLRNKTAELCYGTWQLTAVLRLRKVIL